MTDTGPENPIQDELSAFVDGELNSEARARITARLESDPAATDATETYERQKSLLHALFDPVLQEPVPQSLIPPEPRLVSSTLMNIAAAAAYLVVGGMAGWWLHERADSMPEAIADLPERAVSAHAVYTPEVRHPVEVTADQQAHLVKWLTKRLGVDVRTPVLSTAGYELVGGRLLPGLRGPAAHFMYQEASGERLTLYVRAAKSDTGETAFRYSHEGGIGVFYWIDSDIGYALAGRMEKDELLDVANLIYRQLNP